MTQRLIAIDVGAGTADIVVRRDDEPEESSVKLVVPSQTRVVAARIAAATRSGATVVFAGPTMGGGADTRAMKAHTGAGLPFLATETAALSFADDLDRVRARGVQVVTDDEAGELASRGSLSSGARAGGTGGRRPVVAVRSGDVDAAALLDALRRLGVDTRFDGVAVAVQDHGFCPGGSNRVFRFSLWEGAVRERRALHDLFYWAWPDDAEAGVPAALTRMRAAAACAAQLLVAETQSAVAHGMAADIAAPTAGAHPAPTDTSHPAPARARTAPRLLAGDTGPAALLGALTDAAGTGLPASTAAAMSVAQAAAGDRRAATPHEAVTVLVNVGNGHTFAAVARHGRLAGVYEHHTGLLDAEKLELQLRRFLAGGLSSDEVRADGGHGAVLDTPVPLTTPLLVTGPNRALLRATRLAVLYPAPWGDMMIAGAVGLLEAFHLKGG